MPIQFVGPALQGASMISRFGIPLLKQAGISAGLAGLGALVGAASKTPSSSVGINRRAKVGSNRYSGIVGSIPPSANGESYRRAELRLGDEARPGGAGGGGGNAGYSSSSFTNAYAPDERAYQGEKNRVAQLTEQDPLFKKYRVAELTDAYNKAKGDERERIGLEIWAITNPRLAKQVPPGQVGYRTSAAMSGTQVFGSNMPGITQATYQQASEGANNIPYYGMNVPGMSAYGLGANAQQIAFSPSGQPPVPMLGKDVFNKGFDIPSSEDLTQTQLALLKRAFEGRLK